MKTECPDFVARRRGIRIVFHKKVAPIVQVKMNVAPKHMALDCVFRLLHSLHHTDSRQNFLCKGNQQTTEQTEDALRSLRRVVGLHGHTELHNAPA